MRQNFRLALLDHLAQVGIHCPIRLIGVANPTVRPRSSPGEEDNICLERWNQGQVEVLFFVLLLGELKVICI